MKKHAAIRIVVALVMFANSIAWGYLNGLETSGAVFRREQIGFWALAWGLSAVIGFVFVLIHALTRALARDVLALFDVVTLSEHEALRRKHEGLRKKHGSLIKTHRALAKDHRVLKAEYDHLVYQRDFVKELDDKPLDQATPAPEPAPAH